MINVQGSAGERPSWTIEDLVSIDFDVDPDVVGEVVVAVLSKHADLRESVAKRWAEDDGLRAQLEEDWPEPEAQASDTSPRNYYSEGESGRSSSDSR